MTDTQVLIAGAGPVGLTAALELRRRGVDCRIVDRLPERLPFAKAVGVQPRTLEIWERSGVARAALDAATPLSGQLVYVNGSLEARIELAVPPQVPYGFASLPQYETERVLGERLAGHGTAIERGTELVSFTQDADGVTGRVRTAEGEERELRAEFLVGCDGAHSVVRKGLGLPFEGGAFPEEYMLADVELDWDLPAGHAVRAMHLCDDGAVDDLLVCIPLPGRSRYRISTRVPPELSTTGGTRTAGPAQPAGPAEAAAQIPHGLEADRAPRMEHIEAALKRLAPVPAVASTMRWSSVFRISHRIAGRYGEGRVFLAGDAAHIHPPTGAQGMNTGIQDAYNLAWKLALTVEGLAQPRLLDSYDTERRPVGEEVVERTVRHAARGVQADPDDGATVLLREAQLLISYRDSPVVEAASDGPGPAPGDRAPDCTGLRDPIATHPLRLYDLLRERDHVLLLYASAAQETEGFDELADSARNVARGALTCYAVLAPDADASGVLTPVLHDGEGEFRRQYALDGSTALLVRPDGHLAARISPAGHLRVLAALSRVFYT
ncbi:FAD-dependent monooxygenase [Streptomyces anandii]|uniref:FAD-dependent monooxygenase n=1 Tax=Streptomyces anandii TaxID=285454 RepID=UPI0037A12B55